MVIILASLIVLYMIIDTIREWNRSKWFVKGYVEACLKYEDNEYRTNTIEEEAEEIFQEKHGFNYN